MADEAEAEANADRCDSQFIEAVHRAMRRFKIAHAVIEFRVLNDLSSRLVALGSGHPGDDAVADRLTDIFGEALERHADELNEIARQALEADHDTD